MKGTIYLPDRVARRIKQHEYIKGLDMEKLGDNPVCPRCEKVALRDIGYTKGKIATCPHCGYSGEMRVTLREYAGQKMYK